MITLNHYLVVSAVLFALLGVPLATRPANLQRVPKARANFGRVSHALRPQRIALPIERLFPAAWHPHHLALGPSV